jgi:protocatechuate 3,4-dioxygenase beta subunit
MRVRVGLVCTVLLGCAAIADAQVPASAAGMGSVSGHVTCGDTQKPARFATVMLLAVPTSITPAFDPNAKADPAAMAAMMKATMSGINIVQTQTGVDGSFVAPNVAPGDYYVFASVPGYVQPLNQVQAAQNAGVDLSKPIPGITMVHVAADHAASGDVTVERGAAVSGKVLWDDGSPVPRAIVTVQVSTTGTDGAPVTAKPKDLPPQFGMLSMAGGFSGGGGSGIVATSDDLGQYRIAGLAPGSYAVKVTLQVHSNFSMQAGAMNLNSIIADKPLVLYAPAALHRADAKALTLKRGDEQTDEDVTINLAGMHTVSGRVSSAEDHHGINSAMVELTDASDKDVLRGAGVDASGGFSVTFVPPGTYNVTVTDAEDTQPANKQGAGKQPTGIIKFTSPETVRSYEDGKQSVIVTDSDVVGLNIDLTPSKTVKKGMDLNDLMKQ